MWIVIEYSKKLVKSDYFGVIICIWWRRFRKIRIFAKQNAKYTVSWYEDSKYLGLSLKITQFKCFMCRIFWKLRTFGAIFPKNWEIRHFCVQILTNLTNHKQIFTKYLQFYMWVYKGIKVNISGYHTKNHCSINFKINPVQITTITAENTKICSTQYLTQ